MKTLTVALLLAFSGPLSHAQQLSNSDREAILEKLETIRKQAGEKVDSRFRTAISAYRAGMSSDDAAMDLYLKCEELVNFDEMQRKNADFREWKRRNADKLSDKGFREALRQQLRWLVLTLEAASEEPDRDKLALEAGKVLDSIVAGADEFSKHRSVLQQGVTGSVFARAYNINGVKAEEWPMSPVPVAAVYEQVIFPPLRSPDRIPALKSAWSKRMIHESTLLEAWSGDPDEKQKPGTRSPAYEKFVSETIPMLQWDAEMDFFKSGDQQGAALRMLKHIDDNMSHDSAPKWIEDFTALLHVGDDETAP